MPTAEKTSSTSLDLAWVRAQFPSLSRTVDGRPAVFLDGPGGTQVPRRVIDAISGYLARDNANTCGAYETSRETDRMIAGARAAMGDFLNCDADEIVFGANMTSLTYAMSRSIGRELGTGDEIVLTLLDHDANFSPWKALEEKGVTVRAARFNAADCTLDMEDLARQINSRTRVVAVGYASNAVGTINDVAEVVRLARHVGALSYIDAVHYAPHGLIDVQALGCDFLVCSTYKFFGPHMGVLFGKREHLARLQPYKVRPNTENVPQRWEWGTLNHECIAGIGACVEYWEELGRHVAGASIPQGLKPQSSSGDNGTAEAVPFHGSAVVGAVPCEHFPSRREAIVAAHAAIHPHERAMTERMIAGLLEVPGLKLYGIGGRSQLDRKFDRQLDRRLDQMLDPRVDQTFDRRCATFAVRVEGHTPLELATNLGERGFFTWDGNYYAINVTEQLDVERSGGFLRIGLVHYNTVEEVEGFLVALREVAAS